DSRCDDTSRRKSFTDVDKESGRKLDCFRPPRVARMPNRCLGASIPALAPLASRGTLPGAPLLWPCDPPGQRQGNFWTRGGRGDLARATPETGWKLKSWALLSGRAPKAEYNPTPCTATLRPAFPFRNGSGC